MDISTIDVYLDFRSQEKSVITLRQREKDSTQIRVILSDEGVDFLLNGYTPRLAGTKPNGDSVLYNSISVVENTAIFMVDDWMTEEAGTLPLEIRVYDTDSNALKITGIFNAYITKSALDDNAVIKEPKYDALTETLNKVDKAVDTAAKLNESLTELQGDLTVLQGDLGVLETDLTNLRDETITAKNEANTAANLANEKAGLANTAASTANATNTTVSQAESLRVNAENQRVENEKIRQDFYSAYSNLSSYSSSTNYVIGNKVTYQGGTYQCIKNTVGNPPSYNTDNTYWKCIAAKGIDGEGGDMFKYIYDANGKNTDIFEYTDEKINEAVAPLSNPNLLINPDFRINQRQIQDYEGNGYSIDRWKYNSNYGMFNNASEGEVICDTGGAIVCGGIAQYIECFDKFNNQAVTFTVKFSNIQADYRLEIQVIAYDSNNTFSYVANNDILLQTAPDNGEYILSCTGIVPDGTKKLEVFIFIDDETIDYRVEWAKLELGEKSTPFIPPDTATELLKCQRYYEKGKASGMADSANIYVTGCKFFTPKRVNPTVTVRDIYNLEDGTYYTLQGDFSRLCDEFGIKGFACNPHPTGKVVEYTYEADAEIYL